MLSSLLLHFFIPSFRVSIIAVIVILEYVLHLEAINALFSFKEKNQKKKKNLDKSQAFSPAHISSKRAVVFNYGDWLISFVPTSTETENYWGRQEIFSP